MRLVAEHRPEVLLTDLRRPVMDGAEATDAVLADQPDLAVLLLTTFDGEESILSALSAVARGYLTKEAGRAEIVQAILDRWPPVEGGITSSPNGSARCSH